MNNPTPGPVVSVIVSLYNKARYVEYAVESVLQQTYDYIECIVVDDCSTDGSREIVEKYTAIDQRLTLIRKATNSGANSCRNIGLGRAKGEFVIFLDADDCLSPGCIGERIQRMRQAPDAHFGVFPLKTYRVEKDEKGMVWSPTGNRHLEAFLRHDLPWQTMQPIWKRSFVQELGGFDESFERMQDVELHTRALLAPGVRYRCFPGAPDCYFRVDERRKNFRAEEFLSRWVRSCHRYCRKFSPQLPARKRKLLLGTCYQLMAQVSFHFRQKELQPEAYGELLRCIETTATPFLNPFRSSVWASGRWYQRQPIRVPGVNRVIKRLLLV